MAHDDGSVDAFFDDVAIIKSKTKSFKEIFEQNFGKNREKMAVERLKKNLALLIKSVQCGDKINYVFFKKTWADFHKRREVAEQKMKDKITAVQHLGFAKQLAVGKSAKIEYKEDIEQIDKEQNALLEQAFSSQTYNSSEYLQSVFEVALAQLIVDLNIK
jgi:hypothetical protein